MTRTLPLFLLLCTTTVHADIYKYEDEQGHVTLSDKPRPGAQRLIGSPAAAKGEPRKAATKTPTPAHFPKVDRSTQRSRDAMRQQLLKQELGNEQQALAGARASLDTAKARPGADLEKLGETVRLHEKNIEMLNRELANIR